MALREARKLVNTMLPHAARFQLRRMAFGGTAATCVLCGTSVRGFHSHGGGHEVLDRRKVVGGMRRDEDSCPVCHGRDRTRLKMLWLETHRDIGRTPLRVLHVAPDYGLYLWLQRQCKVDHVGTDLDLARYRHIPDMQVADLTALPFRDADFDIILCSHVLEHVPDDARAMAELYRVLRPGGAALLLTPFALDGAGTEEDPGIHDPAEQERRFGQWDHVRLYDREDFLARMRRAGFTAGLYDPFAADPDRARALHLNPLELLPVGTKA